jgi:phosphoinositide-3-kinase regulatory subunit 4
VFTPFLLLLRLQGCGLVVFSQHSEAAAALQALNGRFVWPGARSPMVIEWCDPSKQHKNKPPQQAPAFAQPVFQQQALPHLLPGASNGLNLVPQGLMAHMMLPHSC